MRVSRLFIKFFSALLLVQVAAAVAVGGFIWLSASAYIDRIEQGHAAPAGVNFLLDAAAARDRLKNGGEAGGVPLRLYADDGAGTQVLVRDIPEPMASQLQAGLNLPAEHSLLLFVLATPMGAATPASEWILTSGIGGALQEPAAKTRLLYPMLPLAAAMLVGVSIAWVLARHFAKPVTAMHDAFEQLARGNLDVRLGQRLNGRRDELGDLGRHFDATTVQLQSLLGSQRRLLHEVSHEIRSPLARIQLAVDLAMRDPGRSLSSLARIERESGRINLLVDNLLLLSRLEERDDGAITEEVDMYALVAGVIDDVEIEADLAHCNISLAAFAPVLVRGNSRLLQSAIENVVRNAINHTPMGTRVSVSGSVDPERHHLTLLVLDNGQGVPDAALDMIFEPFYRAAEGGGAGGYGLGLSIVRRAIEAHGGGIRAYNRDEGGFGVEITLPVAG